METIRLKQFKAIVDAGGLLRASEILHISGGGLSKSMKILEAEIGAALFLQKGRGLELTEHGRALYERIPAVLKAVAELSQLRAPAPSDRLLRIVSFEVFTTHFLSEQLGLAFKGYQAEIREGLPGGMEALIAAGDSDFGLTYHPVPHAGVDFVKVGRIQMGVFGLARRWQGEEFSDLPFVIPIFPAGGVPSGVRGLDGWPDHVHSRLVKYRVEMMETAIQMCIRGLAVAFIPHFVAGLLNQRNPKAGGGLQEIPPPAGMKPVFRDVFLIHRRGRAEDKLMRQLAKVVRSLR